MSRSKDKGTRMESKTVEYLRGAFGDTEGTIHRAALHGKEDIGDVHGLFCHGEPMAVEVKNCKRFQPKEWLRQAEVERGNADAAYGVVIFHVNGVGLDDMGSQGVLMTLGTLCKILGGNG